MLDPVSQGFFDHWQGLRREGLLPSLCDFLDSPSPTHAPDLFILDVVGDRLRVRLQGTRLVERWMRDYTGELLYDRKSERFRRDSSSNFRSILRVPCGCYMLDQFTSLHGRRSRASILLLPLGPTTASPRSVVAFSHERDASHDRDDRLVTKSNTLEATWVDLGAGVPVDAPRLPHE